MNAGTSTSVPVTSGSRKCRREPASQSMCSTEWCTAWNGHNHLTSCKVRWSAYSTRSASTIAMTNCTAQGSDETVCCVSRLIAQEKNVGANLVAANESTRLN